MKHDSKWIAIIGIAACIIAIEANACYGTGCYNTYSDMMNSSQIEVDQQNVETRMYEYEAERHTQSQQQNYGAYYERPGTYNPCVAGINCD